MARERLHALDGLRGVAAMGVMAMHAQLTAVPVPFGYLAVDLFFLLSGYVIARSYEPQLRSGTMGVTAYALVRLERLYPMLALGGLVGLALYAAGLSPFRATGGGELGLAIIGQFLLIPFLTPGFSFVFNGAQWSIVLELMANLAHAAALPTLGNRMLAGVVVVSALGLGAAYHHFGHLDLGWTRSSFLYALPRVGFGFFGGVLLERTQTHWDARVPRVSFLVPVLVLLALISVPPAWLGSSTGYEVIIVTLIFPLLVMLTARARGGDVAAALGTLSFPLYAIHYQIFGALHVMRAGQPTVWATALALLPLSWALGKWIDEPLNAARRRSRRAVRIPAPALAEAG